MPLVAPVVVNSRSGEASKPRTCPLLAWNSAMTAAFAAMRSSFVLMGSA